MPKIHIKNLTLKYTSQDFADSPVLDIPELFLEAGSEICLVGPSGSGKTTLLHIIAGILLPTEGGVFFEDIDISSLSEVKRDRFRAKNIGYIFQNFNLLEGLTVIENIVVAATINGLSIHIALKTARNLLEQMELLRFAERFPSQLSQGQRQRVAIIRAIINQPSVILADEPTSSLDPKLRNEILSVIRTTAESLSSTLILVSHETAVQSQFKRVISMQEIQR